MSVLIRGSRYTVGASKYEFLCVRRYSDAPKFDHVYDAAVPWKTNQKLADYLCDNVIYDKHGVVVFNKPYGVSFSKSGPNWKKGAEGEPVPGRSSVLRHKSLKPAVAEVEEENAGFLAGDKVNLFDAMPFIQKNLGESASLRPFRVPEKYTSGVAVFCRTEKVEQKLQKCWRRVKGLKLACESYLAVVSGEPTKGRVKDLRIGVTLDESKTGRKKKAVLTMMYSKNAVLRSEVKLSTVHSQLLSRRGAEDRLASLVRVDASLKSWHFIRLYLASHLLAPVLGDHMFGSRVKKVMGVTLPIDHWNGYASCPQKLDSNLLSLLDLLPGSEKYIPTMLHLSSLTLPGYFNREEALRVTAPPPNHFIWTCARLGLSMPHSESQRYSETEDRIKRSAIN